MAKDKSKVKMPKLPKTPKVKVPKLSSKPSAAIRQALDDLAAIEKMKDEYIVDMNVFHGQEEFPKTNDKCEVCFAGAVMARAGNDKNAVLGPDDFPPKVAKQLEGLDSFRLGDVGDGLKSFGIKKIPLVFAHGELLPARDYHSDKKGFKQDMEELADSLEKFGL